MSPHNHTPSSEDASTSRALSLKSPDVPESPDAGLGNIAAWMDPLQSQTLNFAPYLHAMRRHWMLAAVIGVLCAGLAGPAVWFLAWPAQFKATAYVRIATIPPKLMTETTRTQYHNQQTYEIYKNTQLQIMKNPFVLRAALGIKEVAELRCVRRESDQLEWLAEELAVGFPGESEIMEISMTGDDADAMALLVTSVVGVFIDEVVDRKATERNQRLAQLEAACSEKSTAVRDKHSLLKNLASDLGVSDTDAISVKQENALRQHNDYQREYIRMQFLSMHAEEELKAQKERLAGLDTLEISDPEVNAYSKKNDPQMRELLRDLAYSRLSAARQMATTKGGIRPGFASNAERELQQIEAQLEGLREEIREEIRGTRRAEIMEIIREKTVEFLSYSAQKGQLDAEVKQQREEVEQIGESSVDMEMMRAEIDVLDAMLKTLSQERDQLNVERRSDAPRIVLIQPAIRPMSQDGLPVRCAVTILAALVGLCLPALSIVLWDVRAKRINTTSDVSKGLGVNVLGSVPMIPGRVIRRLGSPDKHNRTWQLRLSESVDGVAARLLRRAELQQTRVVLITSAVAGEGKTTLATQLAMSLARSGHRTVLVDFDLRHPAFADVFGLPLEPGVSEVLRDGQNADELVHQTGTENLAVMTAGRWDRLALAALANGAAEEMFAKLREEFEFVIVDTSPVLPVADTRFVSQYVDAVILSVFRDKSQSPKVEATREILEAFGVGIVEAVVTGSTENLNAKDLGYATRLLESA